MTDFKWFLICVSGVVISIGGLIAIILSYVFYEIDDNLNEYRVYNNSQKLAGIIVAGIGGILALIGCCMTTKRLTGINQLPRIRFNIEWQNTTTNNQQTYQLPVLPQNGQV